MRRTAEEAAETRRRIVREARRCFARLGWDQTSLVAVARHAEVTRGAVYHHFEDKLALLRAVLHEGWAEQAAPALLELQTDGASGAQAVEDFLATYLHLLGEDPSFRELAVVSTIVAPQAIPLTEGVQEKRTAMSEWEAGIASALDRGRQPRGLAVRDAVLVVTTFLHGITMIAATDPDQLPRADAVRAVARAVVGGITSEENGR